MTKKTNRLEADGMAGAAPHFLDAVFQGAAEGRQLSGPLERAGL